MIVDPSFITTVPMSAIDTLLRAYTIRRAAPSSLAVDGQG
jgi:hypothetical protein